MIRSTTLAGFGASPRAGVRSLGGDLLIGSGDRYRIPSPDARVRVWDWKTGKVLTAKELPNGAAVGSISVNGADGHVAAVAVGVVGGHTTVWDSTLTKSIGVLDSAEPVQKAVCCTARSARVENEGQRSHTLVVRSSFEVDDHVICTEP